MEFGIILNPKSKEDTDEFYVTFIASWIRRAAFAAVDENSISHRSMSIELGPIGLELSMQPQNNDERHGQRGEYLSSMAHITIQTLE